MRSLGMLIKTCSASGFIPDIPNLGPFPCYDNLGLCVAFSMLLHSRRCGRHSNTYTQFDTIRKQRSAFSNVYFASAEAQSQGMILSAGDRTSGQITTCPTHSLWFNRWSKGCQTRMGFLLVQNKAISIKVMMKLLNKFKEDIRRCEPKTWDRQRLCMGYAYAVIAFCASLRGSEGLLLDIKSLMSNHANGNYQEDDPKSKTCPPHVIIPLRGRFKGEMGERCHLMPLAHVTASGIDIRGAVNVLIAAREEMINVDNAWAFVSSDGSKMPFGEMNDIILTQLELVKDDDEDLKTLGLEQFDIREDFSINRSFRRGSETHALNQGVPEQVIIAQNRWKKVEAAKGRKPRFSMVEHYADIHQLIPTMVKYSAML